ncbi:Outer membrane protein assembly factor BamD [uncultured Gammaproteobacteria bacterium]
MTIRPFRSLLIVPLIALALVACSSDEVAYVEKPAEQLYNEASAAMEDKDFKEAARLFDEVERQHPYSQWATRSQIMAAHAYYQDMKYDESIVALDRFIQLHPGSEQTPYAYYLKALCYYEQITDVRRDQKTTKQALDTLTEVVRRFPDTEYARDAKIKLDLTNDHLAGKEMEIGRFYLRQNNINAAIGRFKAVIDTYQTTSHAPEALHRLTEAYLSMGLTEEARRTAAVLGHNYPGSEWYQDSYALLVDPNARPEDSRKGTMTRVWESINPF